MVEQRREIDKEGRLALVGMGMFVDVSRRTSASITGQAAGIAMRCQEKKIEPYLVGAALLKSGVGFPDLVDKIVNMANKMHMSSGNSKARVGITRDDAVGIITDDFILASEMMILERDDLIRIINAVVIGPGRNEDGVRKLAEELIDLRVGSRPDHERSYLAVYKRAVYTTMLNTLEDIK